MNTILYLTAFTHILWLILLLLISVYIYSWMKSKISNSTASIILTIIVVYLLFIQYPDFVWFVIIGFLIITISGSDIKKFFKENFKI